MEELERGAKCNSDGAGIAWIANRKVHWVKGLESSPDLVMSTLKEKKATLPVAIHFRAASVGGESEELTHPFPVGPLAEPWLEGNAAQVLFQNGTWIRWDDVLRDVVLYNTDLTMPEGEWSDTRALAFLAGVKGIDILRFLGGDSRLLVMKDLKKDPFSFWGKWVKREGWYQSIATETQTHRSWKSTDSRSGFSDPDTLNEEAWASMYPAHGPARAQRKLLYNKTKPDAREEKEDKPAKKLQEWTLPELQQIVNKAKEELSNAKQASSLYT
jgi:hypothetical protein